MSIAEIIDRERKRAFGFTDDRRCLLTYGDFRRLLMEIEDAAKREECELLAQIAELRQKNDDGKFFTPKAARDAIAGERPLDEMLKAPLPTGNAAAMREALVLVKIKLADWGFTTRHDAPPSGSLSYDCARLMEVVNAALSAPPRNCDMYANWYDAHQAWERLPRSELGYFVQENGVECCENAWLFAPATERKGESDGK